MRKSYSSELKAKVALDEDISITRQCKLKCALSFIPNCTNLKMPFTNVKI